MAAPGQRAPLLGDLPWLGKPSRSESNSNRVATNEGSRLAELTTTLTVAGHPTEPLYQREFKVDRQPFDKWLQYAATMPLADESNRTPANNRRPILPQVSPGEMESPALSPTVPTDLPGRPERGGVVTLQRTNDMERIHQALRGLFSASGVDLSPPKSVFYNNRAGILLVNATQSDLDAIERLVEKWNTGPPPASLSSGVFLDPWGKPYTISLGTPPVPPSASGDTPEDWRYPSPTNAPRRPDGFKEAPANDVHPSSFRRFKVQAPGFFQSLEAASGIVMGHMEPNHPGTKGPGSYVRTSTSAEATRAAEVFLRKLGVRMDLPGRSAFYQDRSSELVVSATQAELDVIAEAIRVLAAPPQVSIKVRFVEVTATGGSSGFDLLLGNLPPINRAGGSNSAVGALAMTVQPKMVSGVFPQGGGPSATAPPNALGQMPSSPSGSQGMASAFTGILTDPQYRVVLRALEQRDGVDLLNAPEVLTPSGRQAQIQIGDTIEVVTGVRTVVTNAQTNLVYKTASISFGTTVDVIPQVLSDGQSISMTVIPTVTEFLGYDDPKDFTSKLSPGERPKDPIPLSRMRVRQITNSAVVLDGQTIVLGNFPDMITTRHPDGSETKKPNPSKNAKQLIVFITPTLIDPAGNRVHAEAQSPKPK